MRHLLVNGVVVRARVYKGVVKYMMGELAAPMRCIDAESHRKKWCGQSLGLITHEGYGTLLALTDALSFIKFLDDGAREQTDAYLHHCIHDLYGAAVATYVVGNETRYHYLSGDYPADAILNQIRTPVHITYFEFNEIPGAVDPIVAVDGVFEFAPPDADGWRTVLTSTYQAMWSVLHRRLASVDHNEHTFIPLGIRLY